MKKYEGAYKSINNVEWTVELFDETVDTETRVLLIAGVDIEWDGDNDKLYQNPIRTSRATVNFVMRDENDFGNFELISQDPEQQWSIRLYRGGSLYWVGRVLADQMVFKREARETGYAIISVTAVDGLNLLANYKMDASMFTIGDRQDLVSLFVLILRKLGLEGAWSSDPYIYDQTQIGNSTASGERIMFATVRSLAFVDNFDIFKDPDTLEWCDCKTALERILNGVLIGARLVHERGAYWILHPANYDDDTWTYDSYDENGTPLLLDTGYNHRKEIDTDSQRPKFEAYPEQSYQQPVRKVDVKFERANGVIGYRNTYTTGAISAVHGDIVPTITPSGRPVKISFEIDFDYFGTSASVYELVVNCYAYNPITLDKYGMNSGGFYYTPVVNDIIIKIPDLPTHQYNKKHTAEITLDAPPTGATEIHFTMSLNKVTYPVYLGMVWVNIGSPSSPRMVQQAQWTTYSNVPYEFKGQVAISQSYTSTAPYKFTQKQITTSDIDTPSDTNSESPELESSFYKGAEYDVGGVRVFNGTNYVDAGNFSAPWTSLTGDLPDLIANTFAGLYSEFLPTITCSIHDDGTLNAIDSLYFDSKIWVLNGVRFNTDLDVWEGTWLGVESIYTTVNNNGEGERIYKKDDIIVEELGDIRREQTKIKDVLGSVHEKVLTDFIIFGEGAPESDPSADKDYNLKIGYRYNSGESYFTPVIEEDGAGNWKTVVKKTDQSVTSSTTAVDDTDLLITLAAGYNYNVRGRVFVTGDAAADFKYFFSVTGTPDRFQWFEKFLNTASGTTTNRMITTPDTTAGNIIPLDARATLEFEGTIQASSLCSLLFKWAQNTSDASATSVIMGSYLEWSRFRIPAVIEMTAETGVVSVIGNDATFSRVVTMAADTGVISVVGNDATFEIVDGDAAAFIAATGITDSTQIAAINQLVSDLKDNSLWAKMLAVYPFVGGTASTHKYNLKDPVDADASFRLTMHGGLTHDANGVTGNGSTGYMDTKFKDSDFAGQNDAGVAVYCRNDFASGAKALYGAVDSGFQGLRFLPDLSGTAYFSVFSSTGAGQTNSDTSGRWIHTRTGSTADRIYRNGSLFKANNQTSATNSTTANILLLAVDYNNGALKYQNSDANIAFFAFTTGLDDTDKVLLDGIIDDYNTTLGR